MDQELAQLHQERDELERGNQNLKTEFATMNRKYVSCLFWIPVCIPMLRSASNWQLCRDPQSIRMSL